MNDAQRQSSGGPVGTGPLLPDPAPDSNLIAAGRISARLDRLPPTRSVWLMIVLLSLGFFFELYDMLFTGYVAPGLYRSGIFPLERVATGSHRAVKPERL